MSHEEGVYSDEEKEKETKPKTETKKCDFDDLKKSTEKWMEEAAVEGRKTDQSLRRQKQMANIVKEDEEADLEEIMKKQLQKDHERDLLAHQSSISNVMDNIPQYYGLVLDTAIPSDKLYWFCWRRAFVHFVTERAQKFLEDGRLRNLWVIAKGRRIPIETERSNVPWDKLRSHINCELIILSEEDHRFLFGTIKESTW
jgi:hypothetical protein